jgi:hypothetical protein
MKKDKNIEKDYSKEEEKQAEEIKYTDAELKYRSELIRRAVAARDERDKSWKEFNGMGYIQWYNSNRELAYAYLEPRKEPEEISITTGTTKNKNTSILNTLLNYNMEPNIMAYDKADVPLNSLGYVIEGMVKKSRDLELYEEKKRLIYLEFLSQGTCFVDEINPKYEEIEKELTDENWSTKDPKDIKWITKIFKNYNQCESNLISGLKVFLGDMKQPFLNKQPYAFTVEYIPRDVAETMFKQFKRWKNVPKNTENFVSGELEDENEDWRMYSTEFPNYVEVVKYQNPWTNEYQMLLNGTMMLPIGFPLSYFTKDLNKFTFSKGDADPIPNFAYSRSIPADTKVSQEVIDHLMKAFLRKTDKSIDPPLAKKGGKKISKKIFQPKNVTHGLDPDTIKEIGKNTGVTSSEVQMYNIMMSTINEMTVSSQFSNPGENDAKTATQSQLEQKQNLNKIGNMMLGAILLEKQMVEHRIPNLLANWTEKIHKGLNKIREDLSNYRKMTQANMVDNEEVLMDIRLVDKEPNLTPAGIYKEEEQLSKQYKKPTRLFFVKAKELRDYKYIFKTEIVPTEKDTDELRRMMFVNNIQEAVSIFGPQSINFEGLKSRYAQVIKEDPEVFFNQNGQGMLNPNGQGMEVPGQGMPQGSIGGGMSSTVNQMKPDKPQKPSINTLNNQ